MQHSTTITERPHGWLEVSCSCGTRLGTVQSRITADTLALTHIAADQQPDAEATVGIEKIKTDARLAATELLSELPSGTSYTYEIVHAVGAAAWAIGNRAGYAECVDLVTTTSDPDPRDFT